MDTYRVSMTGVKLKYISGFSETLEFKRLQMTAEFIVRANTASQAMARVRAEYDVEGVNALMSASVLGPNEVILVSWQGMQPQSIHK